MASDESSRSAPSPPGHTSDPETAAYFDQEIPEYSVERLEPVAEFIRQNAAPGASLVDIGCGTGNTLAYLRDATGIQSLAGVDVSENCLIKTRMRLDCDTYLGSVIEPDFTQLMDSRFDFAVVAAVLHHLIGKTRRESAQYAEAAIRNTLDLLKPGGHLIIHEPVFSPWAATTIVFYVKKMVTRVTNKRVGLFGYWNNIGSPVVSYYTPPRLRAMADRAPAASMTHEMVEPNPLGLPLKIALRRANSTLMVQKSK